MSDEDESADPGFTAAERAIVTFLRKREASEAIDEGEPEERGTSAIRHRRSIRHPSSKRKPLKNWKQ